MDLDVLFIFPLMPSLNLLWLGIIYVSHFMKVFIIWCFWFHREKQRLTHIRTDSRYQRCAATFITGSPIAVENMLLSANLVFSPPSWYKFAILW